MQPVPNAPIPADDFLISDDTDLDAASQWLLGMQLGTAEHTPALAAKDAPELSEDPMALFENHPDILPDPMPVSRASVPNLSATVHPAILADAETLSGLILDDDEDIGDALPAPEAIHYVSDPELLEDVSSGYLLSDDEAAFVPAHYQQQAKLDPPAILANDEGKEASLPEEPYFRYSQQHEQMAAPKPYQQYPSWESSPSENASGDAGVPPQFQKKRQWIDIQNPQSLWLEVLERLKSQMTKPSFETWIAPLRLTGVSDDRVTLSVDSEFNRDWVLKKYRALLTEAFSSRLERMVMIQLDVDDTLAQPEPKMAVFDELPEHLQKPKP